MRLIHFLILSFPLLFLLNLQSYGQFEEDTNDPFSDAEESDPDKPKEGKPDGKILNDSVSPYGLNTTVFFYQSDFYKQANGFNLPDTTITDLHLYDFVEGSGYKLIDLSTTGTAITNKFFEPDRELGYRIGVRTTEPYRFKEEDIRYFNTRSPFTEFTYKQGELGRAIVDFTLSQNVTSNWNIAGRYRRTNSRFIVGYGDIGRNTLLGAQHSWLVNSWFQSNNRRYLATFYYNGDLNNMLETGGLDYEANLGKPIRRILADDPDNPTNEDILVTADSIGDFFRLRTSDLENRLEEVFSRKKWTKYKLYQQYALTADGGLQVYLEGTRQVAELRFEDRATQISDIEINDLYYGLTTYDTIVTPFIDTAEVNIEDRGNSNYRHFFRELGFKSGIKYRSGPLFISSYIGYESYDYSQVSNIFAWVPRPIEAMPRLGADAEYNLTNIGTARVKLDKVLNDADYYLGVDAQTNWGAAKIELINNRPTLLEQYANNRFYRYNHAQNSDAFGATDSSFVHQESQVITLEPELRINSRLAVRFTPKIRYSRFKNLIYYNELAKPAQMTDSTVSYTQIGLAFDMTYGKFRQKGEYLYSIPSNERILRMPRHFVNYQFFYQSTSKRNDKVYRQIGLNFHYETSFMPLAFQPVNQQFYLQDQFSGFGFPLLEPFVNFRVNTTSFFAKYGNALQLLYPTRANRKNYYRTPLYMAPLGQIIFGVRWYLFD